MKIAELKNDWRLVIRKLFSDNTQIYTFSEIMGLMAGVESNRNRISKWLMARIAKIKFENITYYGSPEAIAAAKKIWGLK